MRVGIVLVMLALLWSAAWFYAPPLLVSAAGKVAEQLLGRRLTIGKVVFNPWTLELTLDDVALAGSTQGAPPLLEVKRIHADAALMSLLRLAPVIDAIDVDSPTLRVSRTGEGHYDFDDILQRLAALPPRPKPARFALHNIVVHDGSVDFVDQPLKATHRLRSLEIGVPFLSSLPSEREVKVEPHLAFNLDGSKFDTGGAATPFAERGNGELRVKLEGFSVQPYLGYLPHGLPVQLRSATLGADLVVTFEQRPLSVRIAGSVAAEGIAVVDAAAQDLLQVGSIRIAIDELRPLERRVKVKSIDIDAPHIVATRNAAGHVNLMLAGESPSGEATPVARVPLPTTAASAASAAASGAAPTAPASWQATVAAVAIRAGHVDWRDATVSPPAELVLGDFVFAAQAIAWPLDAPVVFNGSGVVGSASEHGKLAFSGQGHTTAATVKVSLDELPLTALRPYLRGVLPVPLAAELSADVSLDWHGGGAAPGLVVDARRVLLSKLAIGEGKTPEIAADTIELSDAHIDAVARSASIGRLALQAPRVRVERDAARRWAFERYGAPAGATAPADAVRPVAKAPAPLPIGAPPPWKLAVGELAIDKGRVSFIDRRAPPIELDVVDLAVQLRNWALVSDKPAPFRVAARVAVPAGPSGAATSGVVGMIDVRGEMQGFVGGQETGGQAALLLKDLPLQLVFPYLAEILSLDVQKAQASFKGDVRWERRDSVFTRLALRGDANVDDFRATSTPSDRTVGARSLAMVRDASTGRQLLNWKTLSVRGIDLAVASGTPTRLSVASTSLSDFFARIVLDADGRLNVQDVAKPSSAASSPQAAASAASAAPATPPVVAAQPASAAAVAAAESRGARPVIDFGPIVIVNGRVVYNDQFIKPNYSANLSELRGRLAAFSSEPPAAGAAPVLADIELHGRVEGTATLDITGKVNPLAKPLALDLQAKVRDLELPPLSPYAIKYSGYGIERGKMSVDLGYIVQPSGELKASNKIVLNQLAFGDKVEGATASLPVKLAVALLADSHGVIDLDLPVSGSINDPQFSLGGLIWKAISNLFVKAVTAPFTLLASALGGGGSELSRVDFAAGTAALDDSARASLDKIAQALVERPALSLTVTGESRLDVEREAWKKERLAQFVRAEKRRQAIAGGASASAEVTVSEAEYPVLLKEVYRRADIVKPKNVVGLAKDLPPAEMEALLLASITVADDAMQQLAVRRGVAVRDYLAGREIPVERLFLGAPKVASDEASWTPRADLKLAAN